MTQTHLVAPGDRVVQLLDLHRRYLDGANLDDLGAECGLAGRTVLKRFHRHRLPVRPRGKPPRPVQRSSAKG